MDSSYSLINEDSGTFSNYRVITKYKKCKMITSVFITLMLVILCIEFSMLIWKLEEKSGKMNDISNLANNIQDYIDFAKIHAKNYTELAMIVLGSVFDSLQEIQQNTNMMSDNTNQLVQVLHDFQKCANYWHLCSNYTQ